MKVNLFYLSGNTTGGWVTYTAHLIYGLQQLGTDVQLCKVGNNTEAKQRPFGYSVQYRNMNIDDAVACVKQAPSVIVALQKNYRDKAAALLDAGAWMVVHDPAEFANLKLTACDRYITIRKVVQRQVPGSLFIPHPYLRHYPAGTMSTEKVHACSIARIDFDKRTDIMLDANRLLPAAKRIQIHGFENRIYTRFKLCPKYPEWEQSKAHYLRERQTATELCHDARFTVDMSVIKGDGGGTQYTFMEAMDAGSVNIINREWLLPHDEMVAYPHEDANCFAVGNGEDLASLLNDPSLHKLCKPLVLKSNVLLTRHSPRTIAAKLLKALRGS